MDGSEALVKVAVALSAVMAEQSQQRGRAQDHHPGSLGYQPDQVQRQGEVPPVARRESFATHGRRALHADQRQSPRLGAISSRAVDQADQDGAMSWKWLGWMVGIGV